MSLLGVEKSTLNILVPEVAHTETGMRDLDPGGRGAPSTQMTLLGVEKSTLKILGPGPVATTGMNEPERKRAKVGQHTSVRPPAPKQPPVVSFGSTDVRMRNGSSNKIKGGTLPGTKRLGRKVERSLGHAMTAWALAIPEVTPLDEVPPPETASKPGDQDPSQ